MKTFFSILLSFLSVGCGYRLAGTGHSLPEGAVSVAIEDFNNFSTFPESERFVSDAVREEFLKRCGLKLLLEKNQSSLVMEGKINSFTLKPVRILQSSQKGEYEIKIVVSIRLLDQMNHAILFDGENMVFSDVIEMNSADFFTQNAGIIEKIAVRLGKFYVSTILEDF